MRRTVLTAAGGLILLLLFPYVVTMFWKDGTTGTDTIEKCGREILREGTFGIESVDLEEYIIGVAAHQIPGEYEKEAVKAQMILARTYLYNMLDGAQSIEEEHLNCGYLDEKERIQKWKTEEYETKFRQAATETYGQVLTYNGELIEALFHRASAAASREANDEYPYLKSVDGSLDLDMENYVTIREFTLPELAKLLSAEKNKDMTVQVTERDSYGYVLGVQVGTVYYDGEVFASALSLPSASFITKTEKGLKFISKGAGHGYGLSQWGAHKLAKTGKYAEEILYYYYQDVAVKIMDPLNSTR